MERLPALRQAPAEKYFHSPSFQKATFDNCIYEKQALHLFYENFDFYDWAKNRKVYIASFVYFILPKMKMTASLFFVLSLPSCKK